MNKYKDIYRELLPKFGGELTLSEPLFKYTTLRIGGPAALYAMPHSVSDLGLLLKYCAKNNIEFFIIGRGANLLISDEEYEGIVIHLGKDFNHVKIDTDKKEIIAGSGVSLARVLQEAYANSLEGLAFAAGIPATVGGAIASNAGAFGSCVCDFVNKISVIDKDGIRAYEKPFETGYRKGPVKKGEVVAEVVFGLKPGKKINIKVMTEKYFKKRKKTQPLNLANAGSIFKNPDQENNAGKLIEACGLRGEKYGNAMISDLHANFIVNLGQAKASDVYKLLRLAQKLVKEKFGIDLEPEIKLIGNFDE